MRILVAEDGSVVPLDNYEVWDVSPEYDGPINDPEDFNMPEAEDAGLIRCMEKVQNGAVVWRSGDTSVV